MSKKIELELERDEPVFVIDDVDELNADWLHALRLQKLAEKGDKKAAKELKKMDGNILEPFNPTPELGRKKN